jgi:hypothetical protein
MGLSPYQDMLLIGSRITLIEFLAGTLEVSFNRSNLLNGLNGAQRLNDLNDWNCHDFPLGVSIGKSARSPHSFQEPI